ncbi:glycosyltransferase family 4 protein [Butyrivibrio sp. LC3010]|uniref:glycosyltransferase family 4 protein n=1 Tax=Butyrivibrio sp. LC3010 TaxID=1280680 RepID=UPI00047EC908|nr:glycosyltransferase family 4 protein [Butyrivibrio sp. LC3010]
MKILLIDQIAKVNYKYTYSLANALKTLGTDIELVIDDKSDNEYCKCPCHNAFNTSRKDVSKLDKVTNYIKSYRYICKKQKANNTDIVHLQWFQLSPMDYHYIKRLKAQGAGIVVTVHDILPFNEKFYDRYYHGKIYEAADAIIVQAKTNVTRFKELFPECADKVSYIPHGNFLDFADIYEKDKAREHLGIPKDKKVFLFFGQIKKVKGVAVLLEAFGELLKKRDDIYLAIAGSVWKDDFGIYQEVIDRYGLTDKNLKTDIGFIPDEEVGYYYSACDIAVLPYLDVYQSGVIQLSYAYKKPVIATNIPAFTEIVKDRETGYVCEAGNAGSLMETMERTIEDESNWRNVGIAGADLIREKYSWEDIAEKISKEYSKIR